MAFRLHQLLWYFLVASDQLPTSKIIAQHEFIGELALSGELRSVKGVLPAKMSAADSVERCLVVPHHNGDQAAFSCGKHISQRKTLLEVCVDMCICTQSLLYRQSNIRSMKSNIVICRTSVVNKASEHWEIAAAGNHNQPFSWPARNRQDYVGVAFTRLTA